MSAIVAVDGGGTKTDIAILGSDGCLLMRSRHQALAQHVIGQQRTPQRLDAVVRQMLDEVGNPAVVSASVCLADIDFPFEVAEYTAELRQCDWAKGELFVDNDTFALMRTGTSEPTAIAVVCGTGTNCVGRRADGQVARFAAIGDVSGDWGGGYGLGLEAIWYAARSADGRGQKTIFETMVPEKLGLASMEDVILGFHREQLDDACVAALAPLVFEAAASGDEVAIKLVEQQADEIVVYVTAALQRLDIMGQTCPVVLGGGVVAAGHQDLLGAIDRRLAERAPGAYAVLVTEAPIVGAALLAFDALTADDAVLAKARANLS